MISKKFLFEEMKFYQNNPSEEYVRAQLLIDSASNMIDLGSGENPHPKAKAAIDKFIDPIQRNYGKRGTISIEKLHERGVRFVQAELESLPFEDDEFDLAYSHHVLEHVDDPLGACSEIIRIAKAGVFFYT